MSAEDSFSIPDMVSDLMDGLSVRAGNGLSLLPDGLLSRHAREPDPLRHGASWPRTGLPVVKNNVFVFNLLALCGEGINQYLTVPRANVKAYIRMTTTPIVFSDGGGPPVFGLESMRVNDMTLITTAHGRSPTRVNASVSSVAGTATNGEYYWFCGKLFSNGTALGLAGAEDTDDLDFFYPNITSYGWLPPPNSGIHFPPVDVI